MTRPTRLPLAVAAALLCLGAPVGLIWAKVSPRIAVSFSAQGPSLDHPESSEFFATDASLLVVMALAGLLSGVVVWGLARRRGAGVAVGLAVGGLLSGGVAQAVGERVVVEPRLVQTCRQVACDIYDGTLRGRLAVIDVRPDLPGPSSYYLVGILWAVAALVAFAALTAVFDGEESSLPTGGWPPRLVE